MLRKHARVRDQDPPPPAMLAGDQAPLPVSAAADIVAPEDREIAARLPDDLRIVIEGTGIGGLLLIAAGLLLALALGVTATEGCSTWTGRSCSSAAGWRRSPGWCTGTWCAAAGSFALTTAGSRWK